MENALVIVDQAGLPAELATTLELAADFARASKAKTTLAAYAERLARIRVLVPRTGLGRAGRLAGSGVWLPGR